MRSDKFKSLYKSVRRCRIVLGKREIAERRNAGFPGPMVLEEPILIEAKGTGMVDQIWVVTAPTETVRSPAVVH